MLHPQIQILVQPPSCIRIPNVTSSTQGLEVMPTSMLSTNLEEMKINQPFLN